MSSERSEARRKLRECSGLVDSLMYIVQSQINCKDVDNKVISVEMQYSDGKLFWTFLVMFLKSLSLVGGEQCLPFEESILSGASRSARL